MKESLILLSPADLMFYLLSFNQSSLDFQMLFLKLTFLNLVNDFLPNIMALVFNLVHRQFNMVTILLKNKV